MGDMYGSTKDLMKHTDSVEKGSGNVPVPGGPHEIHRSESKPRLLNRQLSSASFDMGARKIDQVRDTS